MNTQKLCSKCRLLLPATREYFDGDSTRPDGLRYVCKQCRKPEQKKYYEGHTESVSESHRQWRVRNAEKHTQNNRNWQRTHPEKARAYKRKWAHNNLDKQVVWAMRRRATKLKLPANFTHAMWKHALNYFNHCCAYCGQQQGLWNPIQADHFIPLASPDCTGTIATNMLPACRACNSSKRAKDPIQWINQNFSARLAKKILTRIQAYFSSLEAASHA